MCNLQYLEDFKEIHFFGDKTYKASAAAAEDCDRSSHAMTIRHKQAGNMSTAPKSSELLLSSRVETTTRSLRATGRLGTQSQAPPTPFSSAPR